MDLDREIERLLKLVSKNGVIGVQSSNGKPLHICFDSGLKIYTVIQCKDFQDVQSRPIQLGKNRKGIIKKLLSELLNQDFSFKSSSDSLRNRRCKRCCISESECGSTLHEHHYKVNKTWGYGVSGDIRHRDKTVTLCPTCHYWVHSKNNSDRAFLEFASNS